MQNATDMDLLRQYAKRNSEEAFATVIARHVNMVYSAALRKTGNPSAAEEITQAVFVILAKKAGGLGHKTILSGWLHETARLTAANFLRTEVRRARREQEAYMQSLSNKNEPEVWTQIMPLLEDAMGRLGEKDRNAIALWFFEGKGFQEIGSAFGASENAAKKRVAHALEKLRKFFLKQGVASTTAVLAVALSANSVQAAPAVLAKTTTAVAFAKGATASGSTLTLIKGALKIMAWTKAKTAVVVGVAVILAAGTATTLVIQHQPKPQPAPSAQIEFFRASWTNAGYADPQSAVISTLWAIRQGDGEKIAGSFTPELQKQFQQMFEKQMQTEGKSFIEILSQETPKRFSQNTGIKTLDQKTVARDQIAMRVYVPGEQREHTFFLKKIGSEWKVNDIE